MKHRMGVRLCFVIGVPFAITLLSPLATKAQSCSVSVSNKVGSTITLTATLQTSDPNENGEGEPLLITTSGGEFTTVVSAYFVPSTFSYTATAANETITGTNIGFDFDESCTITATVNQPHFLSQAQKDFFSKLAAGLAVPAGGAALVSALCTDGIITAPICTLPSATVAAILGLGAAGAAVISLDPTDNNFTQIVIPVIPSIPLFTPPPGISQADAEAVNALLANGAEIIGIERALSTTLNRAAGASAAGNTFWLNQQLQAASAYEGELGGLLANEVTLLGAFRDAAEADGLSVTLTASEVFEFESQIAASGLPAQLVAALEELGASPEEITEVRDLLLVQDINAVAGTFPESLTSPGVIAALSNVTVFGTPFSDFTTQLQTPGPGEFELGPGTTFILGGASSGINPATQEVGLQVGPVAILIPPGSFKENKQGSFVFQGTVNGISVQAQIIPLGGGEYVIKLDASGASSVISAPLSVALAIGNNFGATTVAALSN